MHPAPAIRLGELCRRLDVPYRHARYVLEEGILPEGVEPQPERGHHRQLTPAQAFWLGIVLKLKQSAVKTPLAARIADFAKVMVRGVTQNLNWESNFSPFDGKLETESRWYVDVGDLKYIRLATDTNPSVQGLYTFPWRYVDRHAGAKGVDPTVLIRVDIAGIARLLRGPRGA